MTIKQSKKRLIIPVIICAIAASFYIYDFILRVMPEALTLDLMHDFKIGAGGLGILSSMFFWGYDPMQIPCGLLFDRYSARKILSITILLSALATIGFSLTHSIVMASLYRFIMGATTAFSFVGALVVGATWFRGKQFAFYTGLVQLLGCAGAVIGIAPVSALAGHYGWRHTSLLIACLGLIFTLLIALFVKDAPSRKKQKSKKSHKALYKKCFQNPQTWWVALFGFSIWAPVTVFASMWGSPFYQQSAGLSSVVSGQLISVIWITIGLAAPLIGWLSNHLKQRIWPMVICSLLGIASTLGLIFIPYHFLTHLLLLIGFGISASALVIGFGLIVDIQPPAAVGTTIGFTNMAVVMGGILLLPSVGFVLNHFWSGLSRAGDPIYSAHTFKMALLVLPVSFLLALLSACLIKETHCKPTYKY
jgi:sugar phosphate permease